MVETNVGIALRAFSLRQHDRLSHEEIEARERAQYAVFLSDYQRRKWRCDVLLVLAVALDAYACMQGFRSAEWDSPRVSIELVLSAVAGWGWWSWLMRQDSPVGMMERWREDQGYAALDTGTLRLVDRFVASRPLAWHLWETWRNDGRPLLGRDARVLVAAFGG